MNANSFASNSLPVGAIFQENPIAPQMAIIPAGTYTMGTPESVFTRDDELDWWIGKETQRQVIVAAPLAVGRFPVTRGEFRAFVKAWADQEEGFRLRAVRGCSWLNPGFDQDDTHPVVCVSWHDAVAYVQATRRSGIERYLALYDPDIPFCGAAGVGVPLRPRVPPHWEAGEMGCKAWRQASAVGSINAIVWLSRLT